MSRTVRFSSIVRSSGMALCVCALATTASPAAIQRTADPVVLGGTDVSGLLGLDPSRIVAYRYAPGWQQIPVQVDERAFVAWKTIYDTIPPPYDSLAAGLTVEVYTDAGTFTGPDPDSTFDGNDELAFMARDTGFEAPTGFNPPGVTGLRIHLLITDPLGPDSAHVYLFESDGSLSPGAGVDHVSCAFNLLAGPYFTAYNTLSGPNPENSVVVTTNYRMRFGDRWARDEVNIYSGGASGADILDRHKNLFAPNNCGRSEDSFSAGEGALIANIDDSGMGRGAFTGKEYGPW